MKIRSNYDFYSVEECEQDAKEMVNLLKMERTCSTMKERLSRLNFEVYDTDCGYIAGSKVEHEGLEYVDYMLLSGHAFKRACERGIDAAKLTKLAIAVANNFDAYAEIHNHRIMPVRNSIGQTIDGTGKNGKTATVVQVEGSNILLIVERYAHGLRLPQEEACLSALRQESPQKGGSFFCFEKLVFCCKANIIKMYHK